MNLMYGTTYIAGPFFNEVQNERITLMENLCKKYKVRYHSPRDFMKLASNATQEEMIKVFKSNCQQILKSTLIIALIDDPDTGTNWEMGYAYGKEKPVLMVSFKNKKVNVMLVQGAIGFTQNLEQIELFLRGKNYGYAYADIHGVAYDFNLEVAQQWKKAKETEIY